MSTRGDILRRAAQVEPDAVPEPWRSSDDEDALATVSDREHYRKNLVTLPDGAGEVPAYVWDFPRTPTIPDEVREEWTRGSAGRVLNAQGQYVSRGSDVPRKSFDGEEPGLLVEAVSRTNKAEHAADPSAWRKGGSSKPSLNDATSMHSDDNTNNIINAKEVVNGGSISSYISTPGGAFSGNDETLTFWIEKGTSGDCTLSAINTTSNNPLFNGDYNFSSDSFSLVSGSIAKVNTRTLTGLAPNGNDVVEVRIRIGSGNPENVGGESAEIRFYPSTSGDLKSTIIHHAQIEEAPNASSPIVTGSSATTRSADDYAIPVGDWQNPNEGTFIFSILPLAFNSGGFADIIESKTTGDRIEFHLSTPFRILVTNSGVNPIIEGGVAFENNKIALALTGSELRFSVNGSSDVREGDNGLRDESDEYLLGGKLASSFRQVLYVPRALPESTLNRITS